MSYQVWSVVFGEQPSASKWNILGSNDASFNDGTGIGANAVLSTSLAEAFFRGRRQNDDSNVVSNNVVTGQIVQFGWAQVEGTGAGTLDFPITFDDAFSAVPVVFAVGLGVKVSGIAANIADLGSFSNVPATIAAGITTSGCTIRCSRFDGGLFATGNYHAVAYIAIGPA